MPKAASPLTSLRFDCIFYYVSDLERALAFYTGTLGLTLSSRDAVARLHVDGVLIELVPTSDPSLIGGSGNARLTFAVSDLEGTVLALGARGVQVSEIHRVQNGLLATFPDPDGNELVLWQYT